MYSYNEPVYNAVLRIVNHFRKQEIFCIRTMQMFFEYNKPTYNELPHITANFGHNKGTNFPKNFKINILLFNTGL